MSSDVLDEVREWLGRYVLAMTDGDLDLLALWAAHTHLAMECYSSPRLLLDSPLPGSGKTTTLEHLQRLCVDPVQMASVSSSSLLVRILQDERGDARVRTLLIDEVDRTLRPDGDMTADLLAVLNSGYKRGATRPVNVPDKGRGWRVAEMPTFAPVALAGNSPMLPDDTRSRCIRVLLMPDLEGRVEESDWEMIDDDAHAMGEALADWADRVRHVVSRNRPAMPQGVVGRFREKWQPMARVAHAAGGHWPAVVADLSARDVAQAEADRLDGMLIEKPHILLLRHLAEIWPKGKTFAPTSDIVSDLRMMFPDHWGANTRFPNGLTAQRFGRMLATHFGVNSERLPTGGRERGYSLEALHPVLVRMGLPLPYEPDGLDEPVEPDGEPACTVCRQRLSKPIVDDGFTTHPGCEVAA